MREKMYNSTKLSPTIPSQTLIAVMCELNCTMWVYITPNVPFSQVLLNPPVSKECTAAKEGIITTMSKEPVATFFYVGEIQVDLEHASTANRMDTETNHGDSSTLSYAITPVHGSSSMCISINSSTSTVHTLHLPQTDTLCIQPYSCCIIFTSFAGT
jgi:hypothetical protein